MAFDPNVIRFKDLQVVVDRTPLDRPFFNTRFKLITDALNSVGLRMAAFDATESTLVQLGLDRLNTVLGPMLATVSAAAELGFLVAKAVGTSVSLTTNTDGGFFVTEGAELFTPPPYLLAIDDTDSTNWGILHVLQWTKSTGDLATHCIYASKTQASTQWTIAASAGVFPAMYTMLTDAIAARDAAIAAEATISGTIVTINALLDAVASGPVASVAGRTGIVTLSQDDIAGLVAALGAKASSASLTLALAGKQDASAKLTAIGAMTWAADKLLIFSSSSAVGTADITAFARTLLDDADAATAQATLGFSAFLRTLLGIADAPAFLSALGVSTFIKTLLDDANAAAARTTLGVVDLVKASGAEVVAGTDDAKYVTPAGVAASLAAGTSALLSINTIAGTIYTLQASDNGKLLYFSAANSTIVLTLPNNLPAGFHCRTWIDTSIITFAAAAGANASAVGTSTESYQFHDIAVLSNAGGAAAVYIGS